MCVYNDERAKPIGVFDSGLGGLTSLAELRALLPNEDLIYFGDEARIPYGTKSPEAIRKFALQDARFLASKQVKAILVACGTVSSNCLPELRSAFSVPVVGVVAGAARRAAEIAKQGNRRIAVLGTNATVRSGAFERAINSHGDYEVISRACPMFVSLAENGYTARDDIAANAIAAEYLCDIADFKPAATILGCTHYPLLSAVISRHLPETVLVSAGREASHEIVSELKLRNLLSPETRLGSTVFFTSDDTAHFLAGATTFLGGDAQGEICRTDIETY